jgi:enterochelin esterase-like enzyme
MLGRLVIASVWAALATPACAAAPSVPQGTIEHAWIPAPSIHRQPRSVRVYLPPSYHEPQAARRRYPVIVLLHGWPGGDGNWLGQGRAAVTLDTMIARHGLPELIALMPNANGPGIHGRSRYLDPTDHSFDIQEFLSLDLVHWADSALRTRPDPGQRAVLGISDGAIGAMNLALRHPEVFGAAGGLSGQYRLGRVWGEGRILGTEPGATARRRASSPYFAAADRVASLRTQALFVGCGNSDGMVGDNRAFHARLDSLHVPHAYLETPGGHSWKVWKRLFPEALRALTGRMHPAG